MLLIQNNCRRNTNAQFFHLTSISKEVTSWRVNLILFRSLLISAGFSSSILLQLILFAQLDFFVVVANRIIQSCLLSLYTLPRSCIQWEDFCCGDETFSLAIFGRFHAGFLFLLLLLSLLSHEDMSQTNPPPPSSKCPALVRVDLKCHRAAAETQRQEYYCCLGRSQSGLSPQIRPLQIWCGKYERGDAVSMHCSLPLSEQGEREGFLCGVRVGFQSRFLLWDTGAPT